MIRRAVLLAILAAGVLAAGGAAAQAPQYQGVRIGADAPAALGIDSAVDPPDEWIAYDKALHFGASFLLTLSGQYVLTDKSALTNGEALPIAAGAALTLGLLKEVSDSQRERHPHFCWRDLVADAAGVALAAAVVGL